MRTTGEVWSLRRHLSTKQRQKCRLGQFTFFCTIDRNHAFWAHEVVSNPTTALVIAQADSRL